MKTFFLALSFAVILSVRAEPGHQFPPVADADKRKIDAAVATLAPAKPAKARKVLIFYRTEGYVHASIPVAIDALEEIGRKTGAYESTASDDMAMFDADKLGRFDAVVFVSTTHLSFPEAGQRKALLDFVRGGKGIAGIHAASACFAEWPEMSAVLGGLFQSHPWHAEDTVAVKIDDPTHPLDAAFGGEGFWVRDEIYQIVGAYSRDHVRVLMSLDMAKTQNARPQKEIVRTDNDFPVAWVREEGAGRVFYCSLGHNNDIFWQPELLKFYLAGIRFALGDFPVDATPSAKLPTTPVAAAAPDSATAIQDRGN